MKALMFCISILKDVAKAKKKGENYVVYTLDSDDIKMATEVCEMLENADIKTKITDSLLMVYC